MSHLIYKELKLSINSFFYYLPLLLALLFFIPNWFYTLVFMYMFWITVPQVYGSYISNQDNNFLGMLPVSKKEIVTSKILALVVIELLHVITAVGFASLHNMIYGVWNFSLDANIAFFGVGFLMFGIFNISFFPYFFTTGYFFGKPVILGTVSTLIYAAIIEYSVIKFETVRNVLEGSTGTQFIILLVGLAGGIALTIISLNMSIKRYETVDR